MGHVVILGVFVADTAYRAERMPIIGETVLGNSFSLGPGGKGSNQAVAAGRLGVKVSMISRLGKDDFGQMALETWKSSGVTPYIEEDKDSYTGAAYIFIEESTGDNAIIISPGAAANISPEDLENKKELIVNADVFITQLEQPIEAAKKGLEIARSAGVKTILNPAPAVKLPNEILSLCDFITPNETETETPAPHRDRRLSLRLRSGSPGTGRSLAVRSSRASAAAGERSSAAPGSSARRSGSA